MKYKTINNKPSVNLTEFVDYQLLQDLRPYLNYAVVKTNNTSQPSRYDHRQFYGNDEKVNGLLDVLPKWKNSTKYPFLDDLRDHDQLASWVSLQEDVLFGHHSIQVIYCKSWATRHLKEHCVPVPETVKYFQPLLDWVDSQNIFSQYGRVVVYVSLPGTKTLTHFDHYDPNVKDEFIWINLDQRKKFYVFDEETETKHYLDGGVGTFDDSSWHGADPMEFSTWSVRIDGVFDDEFLKKSNMYSHFRSSK